MACRALAAKQRCMLPVDASNLHSHAVEMAVIGDCAVEVFSALLGCKLRGIKARNQSEGAVVKWVQQSRSKKS
jgi:hypothetical protein